ncbi:MAG: kinase [Caulobacteraceae bacterium]
MAPTAFNLAEFLAAERLPEAFGETVRRLLVPLVGKIAEAPAARVRPLVVGVTGPQGSGKSTAAAALAGLLAAEGFRAAVLALDDLYLPRAERARLAREVHPLLAVRGVPGTHDAALGRALLESLGRPGETRLPTFDKASDDRVAPDLWRSVPGPVDVVLFEGWCVGARPQSPEVLAKPANALERERDPDGRWRGFANQALAGLYQALFAPIGFQVLLRPPSFETVIVWRQEQERRLRQRLSERGETGGMSDTEVARFVRHYERLTRHIDAEMPARADVSARLDAQRRLVAIEGLGGDF